MPCSTLGQFVPRSVGAVLKVLLGLLQPAEIKDLMELCHHTPDVRGSSFMERSSSTTALAFPGYFLALLNVDRLEHIGYQLHLEVRCDRGHITVKVDIRFLIQLADGGERHLAPSEDLGDVLHTPDGYACQVHLNEGSSTLRSRRRYLSIMTVSKEIPLSLGTSLFSPRQTFCSFVHQKWESRSLRSATLPFLLCYFYFFAVATSAAVPPESPCEPSRRLFSACIRSCLKAAIYSVLKC